MLGPAASRTRHVEQYVWHTCNACMMGCCSIPISTSSCEAMGQSQQQDLLLMRSPEKRQPRGARAFRSLVRSCYHLYCLNSTEVHCSAEEVRHHVAKTIQSGRCIISGGLIIDTFSGNIPSEATGSAVCHLNLGTAVQAGFQSLITQFIDKDRYFTFIMPLLTRQNR